MDRDIPEGGFNVQFRHKAVLTEILENGNCVIYFNVLEGIVFRGDVGIDASEAVFGVGEVKCVVCHSEDCFLGIAPIG